MSKCVIVVSYTYGGNIMNQLVCVTNHNNTFERRVQVCYCG